MVKTYPFNTYTDNCTGDVTYDRYNLTTEIKCKISDRGRPTVRAAHGVNFIYLM